jgi:SAM-dependent methyltransferase
MRATEAPVDVDVLREEIQKTYTDVSTDADQDFIFPTGRAWAEELGYPEPELSRVPEATVESFAGVPDHWLLARIEPGSVVLDLGCGAGNDLLIAAQMTGPEGRVIGIDMTSSMVERAWASAQQMCLAHVALRESLIERLPLEDGSVDVVISHGVIDWCPTRMRCSMGSTAAAVCSSQTWSSTPRSPRTRAPASTSGPAESPARCRRRARAPAGPAGVHGDHTRGARRHLRTLDVRGHPAQGRQVRRDGLDDLRHKAAPLGHGLPRARVRAPYLEAACDIGGDAGACIAVEDRQKIGEQASSGVGLPVPGSSSTICGTSSGPHQAPPYLKLAPPAYPARA